MNLSLPETLPAILAFGGLVLLSAGLLGDGLKPRGKPLVTFKSLKHQVAVYLVGILLIALALFIPQKVPESSASLARDVGELKSNISKLETESKYLSNRIEETANKQRSAQALLLAATRESRLSSIRTVLSSLTSEESTSKCREIAAAPIPERWLRNEVSRCALVINSLWTVKVLVYVPQEDKRKQLKDRLEHLNVPVAIIEEAPTERKDARGLGSDALGIIFPENAPQQLVCEVRREFLRSTGTEIRAAALANDFNDQVNTPLDPYTIVVGVEFDLWLPKEKISIQSKLDEKKWETLCSANLTQSNFENSIRHHFAGLSGNQQATGQRNVK